LLSIIGFLLILGPLVIFHEFGHYIFARLFNVKAEVFSIGFGPTLWKKQLGETELRLSAVPLGGYVKLLGDEGDSELSVQDRARALPRQAPWKRFLIFFGGPLFNFILAVMVFMAILMIGEPQLASVAGRVVRNSPAEQAGLRSGDRIVAVNGEPVQKFEDLAQKVSELPGTKVDLEVRRDSRALHVSVVPAGQEGFSVYGEHTQVGEIQGLLPTARSGLIGISDPSSAAGKAGIRTGEWLVAFNGRPLKTWEEADEAYAQLAPGSELKLTIQAPDARGADGLLSVNPAKDGAKREITLRKPARPATLGEDLGLRSSELFVDKTVPDSPAQRAGIQAGDRLIGIGPEKVESFFELKDQVQKAGATGKVIVRWERGGRQMSADITPKVTEGRDAALKKTTQFTVGVMPMLVWAEPVTFVERVWNPFKLVYRASERMVVFSWRNIMSVKKMFTGDVSVGTLGGPILIGKLAGESISRGLISFLTMMAILSVGLGVLNLLPIPVLDGGHLMLLTIEIVRRKPLSIRQMEIVQQVGLSLILLLMVVVIRNDLARLPFFD
jgi:regulator of sigma E protease